VTIGGIKARKVSLTTKYTFHFWKHFFGFCKLTLKNICALEIIFTYFGSKILLQKIFNRQILFRKQHLRHDFLKYRVRKFESNLQKHQFEFPTLSHPKLLIANVLEDNKTHVWLFVVVVFQFILPLIEVIELQQFILNLFSCQIEKAPSGSLGQPWKGSNWSCLVVKDSILNLRVVQEAVHILWGFEIASCLKNKNS